MIKKDFDLEDPEQKTKFYNATARKLLEFEEALERDNYIQAVSREHFINYEDLKRLVNRLGNTMAAPKKKEEDEAEQPRKRDGTKKDKDDGIRRSQRLLLTWLIENPVLFEKIAGIITAEDFMDPLYKATAAMVFEAHGRGNLNPASILNHFINDEEQYKEVAALFNASLKESLNNEEQKKAFSETVIRIKKNSLDYASRHAVDIGQLQKIIQEQAALKTLHISID